MKTPRRRALRIVLAAGGAVLAIVVITLGYLSIRYSPTYVYRELFVDLGTAHDYEYFPERPLAASDVPFRFRSDASREGLVRKTFEVQERITDLDAFVRNGEGYGLEGEQEAWAEVFSEFAGAML